MLRLEDFMEIQKLHHDGLSVSEIARQLDLDPPRVCAEYLQQAPRAYERKAKGWKSRSVWLVFSRAVGSRVFATTRRGCLSRSGSAAMEAARRR